MAASAEEDLPRFTVITDEDIRWRDIKQIYHALFRATSEIMDSSVTEIALFSSGLRPSENSAIPATSESIISTRASQCMVYLFTILMIVVFCAGRGMVMV